MVAQPVGSMQDCELFDSAQHSSPLTSSIIKGRREQVQKAAVPEIRVKTSVQPFETSLFPTGVSTASHPDRKEDPPGRAQGMSDPQPPPNTPPSRDPHASASPPLRLRRPRPPQFPTPLVGTRPSPLAWGPFPRGGPPPAATPHSGFTIGPRDISTGLPLGSPAHSAQLPLVPRRPS